MSAIPGHKRSFPRDFPMVLFKLDDWHRRCTVERPSEAATGSSRRIVNRVRRCSPVIERGARAIAGPGEAGWNPVDAHTRRTSCRSPFDPIEGDARPARAFLPFSQIVLGGTPNPRQGHVRQALAEDAARILGDRALEGRPVGRRLSWLFPVRDQTRGPVARRLVTM
jgi:hypothetical protein